MSEFRLFYLEFCPYCREVFGYIDELKQEYPELNKIHLEMLDERKNLELSDSLDYYYVPTFYYGDQKLFEGAMTKEEVLHVFQQAMDLESQES